MATDECRGSLDGHDSRDDDDDGDSSDDDGVDTSAMS